MDTSTFVALSGQLALDQRLATLAHNIANAKTPGYRANGVNFEALVAQTNQFETAFSSAGNAHINTSSGAITKTANPLDLAIQGDSFFSVQSRNGTYYTRDGRFSLSNSGELVNSLGESVLDIGGSVITLDPNAASPVVGKNGIVFQGNNQVAQIGLFKIDFTKGFERREGAGLVPRQVAELESNFVTNGISQGYVEESNVNPITEMVKLIQVTRAFEAASTLSDKSLDAEMKAIDALAAR